MNKSVKNESSLIDINDEKDILDKFNMLLQSKYKLTEFLNSCNINLCNKDTLICFCDICDYYEQIIFKKYGKNEVHYVR